MRNKLLLALLAFLLPISMLANVDLMNDTNHSGVRKWNKRSFTYCIYNTSRYLTSSECEDAIRNAFDTWQSKSTLTFKQVLDPNEADFIIKWVVGEHECNTLHEESCGIGRYAHVAFPEKYLCKEGDACWASVKLAPKSFPSRCLGQIHFNDSKHFRNTFFETVALHEIGHLIGLEDQSSENNCVMSLDCINKRVNTLLYSDIINVARLYSFYINGPSFVNDMATFQIPYLPQSVKVEWETNKAYFQFCSNGFSNGNHTAIFRSVGHGDCYIYAKYMCPIGSLPNTTVVEVKDSILVLSGVPNAPSIIGWPRTNLFLADTPYDFHISSPTAQHVCEVEWCVKNRGKVVASGNTSDISFVTSSFGTVNLSVRVRNVNGWSEYTYKTGGITKDKGSVPINSLNSVKKANSTVNSDVYEIQLWNTNRMVRSVKSLQPSYDFDMENLSSGVYVVKVIKDGKVLNSKKVVK